MTSLYDIGPDDRRSSTVQFISLDSHSQAIDYSVESNEVLRKTGDDPCKPPWPITDVLNKSSIYGFLKLDLSAQSFQEFNPLAT